MSRQVISYDDLDGSAIGSTGSDALSVIGETALPTNTDSTTPIEPVPHDSYSPHGKKRRQDRNAVGTGMNGANANDGGDGKGSRTMSGPSAERGAFVPTQKQQSLRPPKRKRMQGQNYQNGSQSSGKGYSMKNESVEPVQHWDDPGVEAQGISYDDEELNDEQENSKVDELGEANMDLEEDSEEDSDDESRNLTHEEIWDDSALIAAWDACNEEYEAVHGKAKHWKKDRAHKSPLWYNVPPEKRKNKGKKKTADSAVPIQSSTAADTQESAPLDFNSFVPTHDASLAFAAPDAPPPVPEATQSNLMDITARYKAMHSNQPSMLMTSGPTSAAAGPDLSSVTADGAFDRAMGAMYWCGYWTAVYHLRRDQEGEALSGADEDGQAPEEEETEMLITTQR